MTTEPTTAKARPAPKKVYDAIIRRFVSLHEGRARQRTTEWLDQKTRSIGGSEIAALLGVNPYSSFEEVVGQKAGVRKWDGGSVACWWGTMFEPVIQRFVEIDCETRLHGTDINVPSPEGSGLQGFHANSPDGYAAVDLYQTDEGDWRLYTTDTPLARAGCPRIRLIVLLEFKCPYRRRPKEVIPKHYRPQVWSGLSLSPVAHLGLFVDAVFRKCALWSLGSGEGYDINYHREKTNPDWTAPIAWGFTGVYAPRLDTSKPGNPALAEGAYEAWILHYKEFGIPYESPEEAHTNGRRFSPDPIDFGDCDAKTFERALKMLDRKLFRQKPTDPCLANGGGAALRTGKEIGAAIDAQAANSPAGFYLLGVIPWKLFEVSYVFQKRRVGFLEEIAPLVRECLSAAASIRESSDPQQSYQSYVAGRRQARAQSRRDTKNESGVTDAEIQNLFDLL